MYPPFNYPSNSTKISPDYENMNSPITSNPMINPSLDGFPSPMSPQPMNQLPPMFPNYNAPQISPPNPFMNTNLAQAQYAHGGHVHGKAKGLSHLADVVRRKGSLGPDMILAHINPEEAQMLHEKFGSTINPLTGLPMFGWKWFRDNFLLPIVGTTIGTMIGGPIGGIIGGGLGGATGGAIYHQDPLMGALKGAGMALGYHALGPLIGAPGATGLNLFGSTAGAGGLGSLFGGGGGAGAGGAGLFSGAGAASPAAASHFGASVGHMGAGFGGAGAAAAPTGLGGLAGGIAGAGKGLVNSLGGPVPAALLGTAVLGTLAGKEEIPKDRPMNEVLAEQGMGAAPPTYYPAGSSRISKDPYNPSFYARGGYLRGHTGGQDDKINAMLSDGEYVIPADVVSDMGDGNNEAGAHKFDELLKRVRHHKKRDGFPPKAKSLDAYMSSRRA